MRARDLMTMDVVTVKPDTSVKHVAQMLLRHRISAVPVVDDHDRLVGIVSEGDLMRRAEAGTERHPSWWLGLLASPEEKALEYVRSHATRVEDIMTRNVVTVDEDAPASRIAALLEEKRIKRVPVCKEGRVVGIVSRADLLHGIATAKFDQTAPGDQAIRRAVLSRLRNETGVRRLADKHHGLGRHGPSLGRRPFPKRAPRHPRRRRDRRRSPGSRGPPDAGAEPGGRIEALVPH